MKKTLLSFLFQNFKTNLPRLMTILINKILGKKISQVEQIFHKNFKI